MPCHHLLLHRDSIPFFRDIHKMQTSILKNYYDSLNPFKLIVTTLFTCGERKKDKRDVYAALVFFILCCCRAGLVRKEHHFASGVVVVDATSNGCCQVADLHIVEVINQVSVYGIRCAIYAQGWV